MHTKIEQIQQTFTLAPLGIFGQAIVTLIISFILLNQVPNESLLLWSVLSLLVLFFRIISIYFFRPFFEKNIQTGKIIQWFKLYRIMLFFSGTLWGCSIYFAEHYHLVDLHFFFLATAFALSGAAVATLGAIFSLYIVFVLPMFVIMTASFIILNDVTYIEISLLILVGASFLIFTSYKDSHNVFNLLERTLEVEQAQKDIIHRLGVAGEYRDNETGLHVKRMSYCSYLLALQAGLSAADSKRILLASPMHDVGKIGIPDHILLKPGRLTEDEMAIMKTHTRIGEKILGDHNSKLMQLAAKIAVSHHERWDGSGYPDGLRGKEIPIEARIVSICDVFDALRSPRPYKQAWSVDRALAYIQKHSGSHFDPELVNSFMRVKNSIIDYSEKYQDMTPVQLNIRNSADDE